MYRYCSGSLQSCWPAIVFTMVQANCRKHVHTPPLPNTNSMQIELDHAGTETLIVKLTTAHTSFLWNALGCTSTPTAITLADSGLIPHQIITIITNVDCRRHCSGSIIADHTTKDDCANQKSSVCTFWVHSLTSSSNTKVCHIALYMQH